jgi:hypothetical protein
MELSHFWEAVSCWATQVLPNILWNLNIHYHVHKSLLLVHILSQINLVHTIPSHPIPLRSILILSSHLHLGLPSGLFSFDFPTKSLCAFFFAPYMLHAQPSHLPWLDRSNYTWWRVEVMKLFFIEFSPPSLHFIPLFSKYSPQHPVLKYSQSVFLRNIRNQISHPYKTTGKIIVLNILIFTLFNSRW